MTHDTYREWIQLAVLGELGDEERRSLEAHFSECPECEAEFQEMRSLMTFLGEQGTVKPTDRMVQEARRNLREAIARDAETLEHPVESPTERRTGGSGWQSVGSFGWAGFFRSFRVGFAGATAVAVGFLAGYLVFGRMAAEPPVSVKERPIANQIDQELGAPVYSNVRVVNADPRSGELELKYDMIRPVRLKADFGDERVQRMLAQAVLNEDNPGAQIRAIRMIDTYVEQPQDEEIKRALITALKTDRIPGVRKQALYVLYKMPFDEDIKEACLHVLANDDNAGLRIAAINILAQATVEGQVEGKDVYDAVGAQLEGDENDYIRIQSGVFLQEVNGNGE